MPIMPITSKKSLIDLIKYNELLERTDIQSRILWFDLGSSYLFLGRAEKAVTCL